MLIELAVEPLKALLMERSRAESVTCGAKVRDVWRDRSLMAAEGVSGWTRTMIESVSIDIVETMLEQDRQLGRGDSDSRVWHRDGVLRSA